MDQPFSFMYIAIYVKNKREQKPSGEEKKKKENVHLERYAPDIFSNSSSYAENK